VIEAALAQAVAPVTVSIQNVTTWFVLWAAVIGVLGVVLAQLISGRIANQRDDAKRRRRAARTTATLRTMLIQAHELLMLQTQHGAVWDAEQCKRTLIPIRRVVEDSSLLQDLDETQISHLLAFILRFELASEYMSTVVARFQAMADRASDGSAKAVEYDRLRDALKAVFKVSERHCRQARLALGEREPMRIDFDDLVLPPPEA
jgi:hypothetical protein